MEISKTFYLEKITDDFGVWQHSKYKKIDREHGYALDDAARGLIVFLLFEKKNKALVCLNYILKSILDREFYGFFDQDRNGKKYPCSTDAKALALMALGFAKSSNFEENIVNQILNKVNESDIFELEHIRSKAYLLIQKCYLKDKSSAEELAKSILKVYKSDIKWFEESLTYANAAKIFALYLYLNTFRKDQLVVELLEEATQMLDTNMRIGIIPAPIGNREWHKIGNKSRDIYGQQPIDSAFMVLALLEGFRFTKKPEYLNKAGEWMNWFYGNNIFKKSLINIENACSDGIDLKGISENFGAESTIMYLWADYEFESISR